MYVSHTLECNYSCGDFCYIIDNAVCIIYGYIIDTTSTMCTCYQATRGIALRLAKLRKRRQRERDGREHTVSTPGCISKRQELVRQVSKDQSTMINTLHKALSSSICHSTVYRSAKA